ncbi:MAG: protein arginine kinase [Syntrophomonadaceae bacterium]|nr:protein arginine kinase [Syntrophomonadaceae bacterium]
MSIKAFLNKQRVHWMSASGPESDVVITSRVRLARNLTGIPFPHLMDESAALTVMRSVERALAGGQGTIVEGLQLVPMSHLNPVERRMLVERHLISPEFAESGTELRGVAVDEQGALAIMVNEEDHLRIQCILSGLQLRQAYAWAEQADNALEQTLDYAFDEKRGYLTACPTNVGTGMRASVMLHLPATALTNQASPMFQSISQLGLTVRGMYGEGSEAAGRLYQISNQVTLGLSEEEIIANLGTVVAQIVEQERLLRSRLMQEARLQLEDKVLRAFGVLTHARMVSSAEALSLLSDVRLGIDLGIVPPAEAPTLNELMVAIGPAHLQQAAGRELGALERDLKRAEVIRSRLTGTR